MQNQMGISIKNTLIKRYRGKLFLSEDKAASAFGCEALPMTALDQRERGAVIRSVYLKVFNPETQRNERVAFFTYGNVFVGGHCNVIFGVITRFFINLLLPRRISFAHTHPFCKGHRPDTMSPGDELVAKLHGVNYMYLAAPTGCLYKYNGSPQIERNSYGELILPIIDFDLPLVEKRWDCRHERLPRRVTKRLYYKRINQKLEHTIV